MRDLSEIRNINNNTETYSIVRFYQEGGRETLETGVSLDEAQAHCNDKSTKGPGYFDGYEVEA